MSSRWRDVLDAKAKIARDIYAVPNQQFLRPAQDIEMTVASVRSLVTAAEPFWWSSEMTRECLDRFNRVDLGTLFYRVFLPVRTGLHWFADSVEINVGRSREPGELSMLRIWGIVWDSYGPGDDVGDLMGGTDDRVVDAHERGGMTALVVVHVPSGYALYPIPNVLDGQSLEEAADIDMADVPAIRGVDPQAALVAKITLHRFVLGFMYASSMLLRERLQVEMPEPNRVIRKQAARAGIDPLVRVVYWRKTEHLYPEGHEAQPVEWSCHWTVQRHPRTYKRTGRTIIIEPYVKGDLTKPYKPPAEEIVNAVAR